MQRWLERIWYRKAPPPGWLRSLSRVYACTHAQLLARDGAYAMLYRLQFREAAVESVG